MSGNVQVVLTVTVFCVSIGWSIRRYRLNVRRHVIRRRILALANQAMTHGYFEVADWLLNDAYHRVGEIDVSLLDGIGCGPPPSENVHSEQK